MTMIRRLEGNSSMKIFFNSLFIFLHRMVQVHLIISKDWKDLTAAFYVPARRDVRRSSGSFPQVNALGHFILRPRGANVPTHDRGTHINANVRVSGE